MLAECKKKVEFLRLHLETTNSKSLSTPGCNCVGEIITRTDLDGASSPCAVFAWIRNEATESSMGVDSSDVHFRLLPSGGGYLINVTDALGAVFAGSISADVYFHDAAWYRNGSGWLMTWSSIELVVNGSTYSTYVGTLSFANPFGTPVGMPLQGVPAFISGDAAPLAIPAFGPLTGGLVTTAPTVGSTSDEAAISGSGGWSWKEYGGTEVGIPIENLFSMVAGGCGDCVVSEYPSVGGDHTNNLTFSAKTTVTSSVTYTGRKACTECAGGGTASPPTYYDEWLHEVDVVPYNSGIGSETNIPRSFKRYSHELAGMPDDFGAVALVSGLPQTTLTNTSICHDLVSDAVIDSSTTTVIHARTSKSGGHLRSGAHAIEAPLALGTPAQLAWTAKHYHAKRNLWKLVSVGACPAGGEGGGGGSPIFCITPINEACLGTVGQQFPGVDDASANPDINDADGLNHFDPIARYENYRVSPHWCYWPPFPKSTDTGANAWLVGGSPADPVTSWEPWKQQQAKHPRLSGGDASLARIDLISQTLLVSPLQGFWKGFYSSGQYTSPLGTDTHKAVQFSVPSNVALTAAETAGWSFINTAHAFGATLDLTPSNPANPVVATYDLGELGTDPRFLPLLLKQVVASWTGGAITSAAITLVGQDNSSLTLGTAPGTFGWPGARPASKYATSCEQDYTYGFATSDTGASAGPGTANDISVASLADPEHNMAFELLPGFTAAKLVFTFNVSSAAVIHLAYPSFNLFSGPKVIPENPYTDILIYDSGPALRVGSHQWSNLGGGTFAWYDPPQIYPYGIGRNGVDGLADGQMLFLGVDPTAGAVLAQVNALYDSTEQGGLRDAALGTSSFLVPAGGKPTIVIANGYETPPVGTLPHRARDANLAETGGYAGEAWMHGQESRRYVTNGSATCDVYDGGGVRWTGPDGFGVMGWAVSSHDHSTTGSEGDLFQLKRSSVELATLSPYHGLLLVKGALAATPLAYDVSPSQRHARAYLDSSSGDLIVGVAGNEPQPLVWSDHDTGITGITMARIRFLRYGRSGTLGVLYVDGSGLHYMQTDNDGGSFGAPMTVTSGHTYWGLGFVDQERGMKWAYQLESDGTVYLEQIDAQLNLVVGRTATNLTGCDNTQIDVHESVRAGGEFRIGILLSQGGAIVHKMAGADGLNFV